MSVENLLIVSVLSEDDPAAQETIQSLKRTVADVQVIHAYERNFRPCVGCNACWLMTPGICAVKDGYEELLKAYLQYETVLFLSGKTAGGKQYR